MGPDVRLSPAAMRNNILYPVKIKLGVIVSWLVQQLHSWRLHRMRVTVLAACCLLLLLAATRAPATRPPRPRARGGGAVWTWVCDPRPGQRLCLKLRTNSSLPAQSEARCRASCSPEYNLWPLPRQAGLQVGGESVAVFSPDSMTRTIAAPTSEVEAALGEALDWQLSKLTGSQAAASPVQSLVTLEVQSDTLDLDLDTKEDYELRVRCHEDATNINIVAETYFGARHALETLFQLVFYDSLSLSFLLSCDVAISDGPFYRHRGVMLDTARNFVSVDMIKTLIDSLSYSKLNVLHWHLTDTQSFPLYLDSLPMFAEYGAYSPEMTYNKWEVEEIVRYAARRGVRVVPELDSPAHVGAGWEAVDPGFTLCVNKEPWEEWCVEPPCGQLNPTRAGMYEVLETIYRELAAMFGTKQLHLGGDEIHIGCWNSSQEVASWLEEHGRGREEADFMYLWHHYLQQSLARVQRAGLRADTAQLPRLVYWTNGLTKPDYIHYLDPGLLAVQVWSSGQDTADPTIKTVAEAGFKMIFSNYDATYLDCGFGGWVSAGNNWCSPYKEWQLQHQNDPYRLLEMRGVTNLEEAHSNVLGGEVALWTEQADGHTMMSRIEPRAAAYGERLWRGPETGGWLEAERRLVRHRERLVQRGVAAETLTHGWCRQHEGRCAVREGLNTDTFF